MMPQPCLFSFQTRETHIEGNILPANLSVLPSFRSKLIGVVTSYVLPPVCNRCKVLDDRISFDEHGPLSIYSAPPGKSRVFHGFTSNERNNGIQAQHFSHTVLQVIARSPCEAASITCSMTPSRFAPSVCPIDPCALAASPKRSSVTESRVS